MTGRQIRLMVLALALLGLGLALAGCGGYEVEPTAAPEARPPEEEAEFEGPTAEEGMVAVLVIDGFGPVVEEQEEAEPVEEGAPASALEYAGSDWGVVQVEQGVLDEIQSEFLFNRLHLLDQLLQVVHVDNCLATPSGQPHISAIGTRVYGVDGVTKDFVDEPHGLLVYSELVELLDAQEWVTNTNTIRNGFSLFPAEGGDGDAEAGSFSPWLRTMELWQKGGQQLALVGIDTDGFTTASAAHRITRTLELLEDPQRVATLYEAWGAEPVASTFEGFVLNMSFVLVPCDPGLGLGLEDVQIRGLYEDMINTWAPLEPIDPEQSTQISGVLEDLTPDLADAPVLDNARVEVEEWQYTQARMVLAYLGTGYGLDDFREDTLFNHEDPLFEVLQMYGDRGTDGGAPVISVAAAGNSQVGFPYAPALWDSVISVSAQGGAYSNSGEVALEGNHPSRSGTTTNEPLQGTSFAAPRLSVKAANYLLSGPRPCTDQDGNPSDVWPPLAYVDMPDADEGGYLFSSAWQNLDPEDAAGEYCPQFLGGPWVVEVPVEVEVVEESVEVVEVPVEVEEEPAEPVHLVGWVSGEPRDELQRYLMDECGVTYELFDTRADYWNKLDAWSAAGEQFDILYMDPINVQSYAEAGYLSPADESAGVQLDQFVDPFVQMFADDGTAYGVPMELDALALFYNRDLFDEVGLEEPNDDWTWDDLKYAASTITDYTGVYGFAVPSDAYYFYPFVFQAGGQVMAPDFSDTWIDSDEAIDAGWFYAGAREEGWAIDPEELGVSWQGEAFGQVKLAMVLAGYWMQSYLSEQFPDLSYGAVQAPAGPGGEGTLGDYVLAYAVSANSSNPRAAWKAVACLTSAESQGLLLESGVALPSRWSFVEDPWVQDDPVAHAVFGSALYASPYGWGPYYGAVREAVTEALRRVYYEGWRVDDSFYQAAEEIRDIIEQ